MEDDVAAKLRRLERHRDLGEALTRSCFHMEDLPLEIQPLVMSLLSLKEAARTSIVARNWRRLWTCYPNLCFAASYYWSTREDIVKIERAKFIDTVNSIIEQHSGLGLNKFCVKFIFQKKSTDHLDRWIHFAAVSKAKIIDVDLWPKWERQGPLSKVYNFPLEVLGAQDGPFIQSMFLKDVSIKPHSNICGLTKLRKLILHNVEIIGDLPSLLSNCCALEDLELIACRALNGCSKLEKVYLCLRNWSSSEDINALGYVFTAIPSISAVKVLHLHAHMKAHQPFWDKQMTWPMCMFMNLRHLICEIVIFTHDPNSHNGVLRFASFLGLAPVLEKLELHLLYFSRDTSHWRGEATGEELSSSLCDLRRLKEVYMSGFRCFRPQVVLLCGILKKATTLETVTIQPMATINRILARNADADIPEGRIREWAQCTSERFGKTINVLPTWQEDKFM